MKGPRKRRVQELKLAGTLYFFWILLESQAKRAPVEHMLRIKERRGWTRLRCLGWVGLGKKSHLSVESIFILLIIRSHSFRAHLDISSSEH